MMQVPTRPFCGIVLPNGDFCGRKSDHRGSIHRGYSTSKQWTDRNPNYAKEYLANNPAKRNQEYEKRLFYKRLIDSVKLAYGCADCHYRTRAEALDFDHLPGEQKLFNIAAHTNKISKFNVDVLFTEIAKCAVVCANCHRIRTANRRPVRHPVS